MRLDEAGQDGEPVDVTPERRCASPPAPPDSTDVAAGPAGAGVAPDARTGPGPDARTGPGPDGPPGTVRIGPPVPDPPPVPPLLSRDAVLDHVGMATVFRWGSAATLGVMTVLVALWAVYTVRDVLIRVLVSLFVAVSLDPAVRWLVRRGIPRALAVTVIFLLAFGLVAVFVLEVVPPMIRQIGNLADDLPGYLQNLTERSRTYRELNARFHLGERLNAVPGMVGTGALNLVRTLFGAVFTALTVTVLTIYFMADLPRLERGVVRLFPAYRRPQISRVVDVVVDKVGGYMIGNIIISLIAGLAALACFTVMDVRFAVPLAILVAITDLIPMIGATIGAVICTGIAALTADLWPTAVVVAIFFIVYQQFENYLIAPRVLRNAVDLSAVAVLVVALLGGSILGLVGALMAIPVAAAVKVLLSPAMRAMDESHEPPPAVPAAEVPAEPTAPIGNPAVVPVDAPPVRVLLRHLATRAVPRRLRPPQPETPDDPR